MKLALFIFLLGISNVAGAACPPFASGDYETPAQARTAHTNAVRSGDWCLAGDTALHMTLDRIETNLDQAFSTSAKAIEYFRRAGDYRKASIEGLRMLSVFGPYANAPKLEKTRFEIVQAVYSAAVQLGTEKDGSWAEWALGITFSNKNHPYLSLFQFEKDYPQSSERALIQRQKQELMNSYIQRELNVANLLIKQKQTYAALSRLETLYTQSMLIESPAFKAVVEHIIVLQDRLILEIPKMPRERLYVISRSSMTGTISMPAIQNDVRARMCKLIQTWPQLDPKWVAPAAIVQIKNKNCR
ncbi:MAG: hypothetical protein AB7O96_18530 [Pseudobdellovibrionaceae bacterium]